MTQLGLGTMIHMLSGDDGPVAALQSAIGKTIQSAVIDDSGDGSLRIQFTDGARLSIWDDARSCCESRYMTTDDDLGYHVGASLVSVEVADGPTQEDEYGDPHETQFLNVTTSKGVFTCVTHNEHNGWYGGFWMVARLSEQDSDDD